MAGPVDALSILLGGPQGPTPPLAYGSGATSAGAPTQGGAGGPINELIQLYGDILKQRKAQMDAQAAQAQAMQPHGVLQTALQAMARTPGRESPLGDFLLSLLMGATGTPNPLTQPQVQTGKAQQGLPSPMGIASLARLTEGAKPKQATPRYMMTGQGVMEVGPEGAKAITGPEGQRLTPPTPTFAPHFIMTDQGLVRVTPGGGATPLTGPGGEPLKPPAKTAAPHYFMTDQGLVQVTPEGAAPITGPAGEVYHPATKPKSPKVLTNQGVPYGVDDGAGKVFTFDDANIPPDLKKLLGAADTAHAKKLSQLTSTTRTMVETAPSLIRLVNRTLKRIDENVTKLGPAVGRWNEFYAGKVGAADKSWTQLRTDVGLVTTLLMRMHVGARGGEYIMKKFDDKFSVAGQAPENLKAALREVLLYADDKILEGKAGRLEDPIAEAPTDHPVLQKHRRP